MIEEYDVPSALGTVVETDRGSLPFALIHGEGLVAAAGWALGESGVTPVDFTTRWSGLQESGEAYVLHDALCPMTPAEFITRCLVTAVERDVVVVGVRPVTDTVKTLDTGSDGVEVVGATVARSELLSVVSPIVLPAGVVAALEELPTNDFAELAALLAARFPVVTLEAPAAARRVGSPDDVRLLEALTLP